VASDGNPSTQLQRFPRVQDCVSDGRLVTCAKASAGKRDGSSGTKIRHACLTWAFSEAAVLFLRDHQAGQQSLTRWEKDHGQGNALTVLAQQLARAVYDMLTRHTAFERQKLLQSEGSGAREPAASLDAQGLSLSQALCTVHCVNERQGGPRPCALSSGPLIFQ
jgi:hypothetical protein